MFFPHEVGLCKELPNSKVHSAFWNILQRFAQSLVLPLATTFSNSGQKLFLFRTKPFQSCLAQLGPGALSPGRPFQFPAANLYVAGPQLGFRVTGSGMGPEYLHFVKLLQITLMLSQG